MDRKWYDLPGYEGLYAITRYGIIKSLSKKKIVKKVGFYITKEKILRHGNNRNGDTYPHVCLTNNGIRKTELIHRLIAITFIPNPFNYKEVNHINGNKNDFSIPNLEWCNKSMNQKHAYKYGLVTPSKGEANVKCKVTDAMVFEIREKYKTNRYSQRELANQYGISQSRINFIINRKTRV